MISPALVGLIFRRPLEAELVAAYSILRDRHDWLHAKGLEGEGPLFAFTGFSERQERGQNFCLFRRGEMVATICLKKEPTPEVYRPFMPAGDHWWIYALSTRRSCAGKGYGAAMLSHAIAWLEAAGAEAVYLDCLTGNGFLPAFYQRAGFQLLGQILSDEGGPQLVEMNLFVRRPEAKDS